MTRSHDVRIGTSGWNYPASGYGPWTGVFYSLKQGQTIPGTKWKSAVLAPPSSEFCRRHGDCSRLPLLWVEGTPRFAWRGDGPLQARGRRRGLGTWGVDLVAERPGEESPRGYKIVTCTG